MKTLIRTLILALTCAAAAQAANQVEYVKTKDPKQPYAFHFKSTNGQVVLQSEGYSSKQKAEQGAAAVVRACQSGTPGLIQFDSVKSYWFVVRSENGEDVGRSEVYVSKSNAQRAAKAFAEHCPRR